MHGLFQQFYVSCPRNRIFKIGPPCTWHSADGREICVINVNQLVMKLGGGFGIINTSCKRYHNELYFYEL